MSERKVKDVNLLLLTRDFLDTKAELASVISAFNERIKELEAQIAACVKQ